ncbi:uncharacterized protein [Spinacia oleracea]|uniref:Reverse transcriptase domain-containing protein n=1 Tax=Spinacia oleracea TaxID=3562 RepID=A0ABM3R9F8_SPIOL|nr:uncharacterized protein LOC130467674 [Spinacia oleracea]
MRSFKCDPESELEEGPKLADCGGTKAELGQQKLGIWTTNSSTGDESTTPTSSSKRGPNRSFAVRNSRSRYGSHRTPYSHVHHQGGGGGGANSAKFWNPVLSQRQIFTYLTPIKVEDIPLTCKPQFWKDWENYWVHCPLDPINPYRKNLSLQRPDLKMKICMWNVRGACRDLFKAHAKEIVNSQHPDIFIFLETKSDASRGRDVMNYLNYDACRTIRPVDKRGGIWVFWKKTVDLIEFDAENNHFHSLFRFKNLGKEALVTGMHAPSTSAARHKYWRNMQADLPPPNTSWLVLGDLNEVTNQSEKKGGRQFRLSQCSDLVNFMDAGGLVDIGYNGCPYTWTNARQGLELIQERLDRALVNSVWLNNFPFTKVHHLPRTYSDHSPILISLTHSFRTGNYPFRCKEVWLTHPDFSKYFVNNWMPPNEDFLKGKDNFNNTVGNWNYNIFESDLINELNDIYKKERIIWAQKSGLWITNNDELKSLATDYFAKLFTTTHTYGILNNRNKSVLKLLEEEKVTLDSCVSLEEVWNNLFNMAPIKAPGRMEINYSYIALIPKIYAPSFITEFQPIGLCNTIYKIITKIISSRLKLVLGRIVSPLQSSFIKGRGVEDNVILVKEMAHHFHKAKKRNKIMALKLDISKAYDSLEWDFIRDTLIYFDFPNKIIHLIMSCITSPVISILWNGEICDKFTPSRGIRQGDPLSSYIFVLCLDRLSSMIEEKVQSGSWKPIALTKNIKMSHVFYADDVFLFSIASIDNMHSIMNTLESFGEMSGLKISMTKSTLIFPRTVHDSIRQDIASTYGFKISSCFGKYLGVDIRPNKLKISNYLSLLDKSTTKVRGWQAKLLNMAGRRTLIKSVLNSQPLYVMQTNLLPASTIYELEICTRKFLWNKPDQNRYMSRLSWDKITSSVTYGGLGIRRLKEWNLAFMAKLGWTIPTKPDKLWVKLFKEKYINKSNFMDCISNGNQSALWRDILKGRRILQKGLIINIGNGQNTSLWYHHWVGEAPLYTLKEIKIPNSKAHWFVSKIIRNGRLYLKDIEHLIPTHIQHQILAYPLSTTDKEEDFIRWNYSKNGTFNIKSSYFCQIHAPISHNIKNNNFWNSIWKIKVPYKYRMLLWNCRHEILPELYPIQYPMVLYLSKDMEE